MEPELCRGDFWWLAMCHEGRLLSRRGGQLERFCVWVVPEASLVSEEPGLGWSVSAMCLPSGHSLTGGEDGRGAMLSTTGQGGK